MKRVDNIFIAFFAAAAIMPVMAQVDKSVEVTQAFIPQIMSATKPELQPDMSDESYINPDIDYSITPISIHNEIDTTPYKAVEMDYWEYKRRNNFYAKVGGGAPMSFLADLYASKSNSKSYKMGYLNYDGKYADIRNDYGVKSDASQSHLKAGAVMGVYVGRREFVGDLNYTNDRWSRYATAVNEDEHPLYQRLNLALRYGDNFTDMSRWNYSVRGGAERMWSRSKFDNTIVRSRVDFGHEVGKGGLLFSALYNYVGGSADYRNHTFGGGILYQYERKRAEVSVGGEFYHEGITYSSSAVDVATSLDDTHKCHFIPRFNLDVQLLDSRLIGYVEVAGEVERNDFSSLALRNPYVKAGMFGAASTVIYNTGIGFKGTVADSRVGYNVSWRYARANSQVYWIFNEQPQPSLSSVNNDFIARLSDQDRLNMVMEAEYRPNAKWNFGAECIVSTEINKRDHGLDDGVATTQLRVDGEYKVESFSFRICGEMLSPRVFTLYRNGAYVNNQTIHTTFDLAASAEYRFERKNWALFCDVTNIINDDLYEWVGYREYGIGAMVGAKFEF